MDEKEYLRRADECLGAVAKWLETLDPDEVDYTTGDGVVTMEFPDGGKFKGASGLRQALLSRPELFVSTLTEKLLTYGLGRGLESYDEPAVRKIVRDAHGNDYRFSSLILGIVNSTPFQMRRSQ